MRKFIQPVSMTCPTSLMFDVLKNHLLNMGYRVSGFYNIGGNIIVNNYDAELGEVKKVGYSDRLNAKRYYIDCYDQDFFLALSAMSEGVEIYSGEWVKVFDAAGIYKTAHVGSTVVQVIMGNRQDPYNKSKLRKATKEEIINHFTNKGMEQSSPSHERPPLGIQPRWLFEEGRIKDLMSAIIGYIESKKPIPQEWREELDDLLYRRVEQSEP